MTNERFAPLRTNILEMDHPAIEALVTRIQERRLASRRLFEAAQKARAVIADERAREDMAKLLKRMEKACDAIDKASATFQKAYDQCMLIARVEG